MTPFDLAWDLLKSAPVSPGGKQYSPAELQSLRSFVNANIESPDPNLREQAEQILQELTAAMSGSRGHDAMPDMPSGPEAEAAPEAAMTEDVPMPVGVKPPARKPEADDAL